MFPAGIGLNIELHLTGRIVMPVENLIVLLIVGGAMAAFMLVLAWLSLDRNKLPRDNHGVAE
jgi:hypothetical protein